MPLLSPCSTLSAFQPQRVRHGMSTVLPGQLDGRLPLRPSCLQEGARLGTVSAAGHYFTAMTISKPSLLIAVLYVSLMPTSRGTWVPGAVFMGI